MKRHALAAGITAAAFAALADIVAPDQGTLSTNVAASTAVEGLLVASPLSRGVCKTGGGTLSFDTAQIAGAGTFQLNVLTGKVSVASSALRLTSAPAPLATLAKAALWLEAGTNVVYATDGTHATAWRDVRDLETAGAWSGNYIYAVGEALALEGSQLPQVRSNAEGRPMVYFNGAESGSTMVFTKPNGSGTLDITGVRHIFLATRIVDSWGYAIGNLNAGDKAFFQPASIRSPFKLINLYQAAPQSINGRFFTDGQPFDPTADNVEAGMRVLEWSGLGKMQVKAGSLFRDRNFGASPLKRSGGDDIGEVAIFTNDLTTAERVAVERYLIAKWKPAALDPANLSLAFGNAAGTDIAVAAGETNSFSAAGSPTVAKTGDGTLVLADGESGSPKLALSGGKVIPQLGTVGIDIAAGSSVACSAAKGARSAGAEMVPSSCAASEASLSGPIAYRATGVPADVKKLSVGANALVLSADDGSGALDGIDSDEVVFEDPSFEKSGYAGVSSGNTRTINGWTFRSITASVSGIYYLTLPNSSAWTIGHSYPAPDGTHVIGLKGAYELSTTVALPKRGVYELSFMTCKRMSSAKIWPTTVGVVQGTTTNWLGRCRAFTGLGFKKQRFKTPILAPGDCTIIVAHYELDDCMPHVDDFHMRYIPHLSAEETVPVPNGNCEMFNFAGTPTNDSTSDDIAAANTLDGWTFTDTETGSSGFPSVALASVYGATEETTAYARGAQGEYGECNLVFHDTGSKAETTDAFKVGKGRWRLRMKSALWRNNNYSWHGTAMTGSSASLTATLTVNGSRTVALGSVVASTPVLAETYFPNAVTLSETDEVKLSLVNSTTAAAFIADDLEFVRVGNLVDGGDFETAFQTKWGFDSHADASDDMLKKSRVAVVNTATYYGEVKGEGSLLIDQIGEIWQTLPETPAGLYKLEFLTHPRADSTAPANNIGLFAYGGNAVRAYLAKDGVTNEIGRTGWICATNFARQTFYVDIPEDGAWTLGLQGVNGMPRGDGRYATLVSAEDGFNVADASVLVDDVSFGPASLGEKPAIAAHTSVSLSDGTRLQLDYTGTLELQALRVGGHSRYGTIDASDPSGLVSGPGSVYVNPANRRGVLLIVR